MNKLLLSSILICLLGCNSAESDPMIDGDSADQPGAVLYLLGWEVQTITGWHEENFPGNLPENCIDSDGFREILELRDSGQLYDPRDVKALLITRDGKKYYIDYSGDVRSGQTYYKINVEQFLELASIHANC